MPNNFWNAVKPWNTGKVVYSIWDSEVLDGHVFQNIIPLNNILFVYTDSVNLSGSAELWHTSCTPMGPPVQVWKI